MSDDVPVAYGLRPEGRRGAVLHISRNGNRYGCLLEIHQPDSASSSADFELAVQGEREAISIADKLRETIHTADSQSQRPSPTVIDDLIFRAKQAFKSVFGNSSYRQRADPNLPAILDRLFGNDFHGVVHIVGDFNMPWEALYYDGLAKEKGIQGFWGYSHVLQRWARGSFSVFPLTPLGENQLRIGLMRAPQVKGVLEDHYLQDKAEQTAWIHFDPFTAAGTGASLEQQLKAFTDFLEDDHAIKHLICHAAGEADDIHSTFFQVTADFSVTYDELKEPPLIRTNAMIFANMCHGAGHGGTLVNSFAHLFILGGARIVITPDIAVNSEFAAAFAKAFYGVFLSLPSSTPTAGLVLRDTRRQFLDFAPHPRFFLALAYGLHGHADWSIHWNGRN